MSSQENVSKKINNWIKGLKHGSYGAFAGFLAGALISAIFALSGNPPVWAINLPYVGALGGFTFGFMEGSES